FSSRRRHTRFSRDWSSDVCSSDLNFVGQEGLFVRDGKIDDLEIESRAGGRGDVVHRDLLPRTRQAGAWGIGPADPRGALVLANEIGRASCRERVWRAAGAVRRGEQ